MIKWRDSDYYALVDAAREVNARPSDLLLVLYSESGLNPASSAKNKDGEVIARGLNQITKANYEHMKMSESEWEAISSMTPEQNLYYVVKSLKSFFGDIVFPDAGTLYQVNFAPAKLKESGSGDDVVLYTKPSKNYYANEGLDSDKKGYITVRDMRNILKRRSSEPAFLFHYNRLKELYPAIEPYVIGFDEDYGRSKFPISGIIAILAIAGGMFWYWGK